MAKPELTSSEVPINQYRIVHDLMHAVDRENTIVTHDSGSPREQMVAFWQCLVPGAISAGASRRSWAMGLD